MFDPAEDLAFQADEAAQLERTMMAYLPLLGHRELEFGIYCAALSICGRQVSDIHTSLRRS